MMNVNNDRVISALHNNKRNNFEQKQQQQQL